MSVEVFEEKTCATDSITPSDWTEISLLLDFDCFEEDAIFPLTKKRKTMTQVNSPVSTHQLVDQLFEELPQKKTKKSSSSRKIRKEHIESKPLPDPKSNAEPIVFLKDLVQAMYGFRPTVKPGLELDGYSPEITEEQIAAYDMEVITAARNNDLDTIKALYEGGKTMDCCNRFGESLLHLACRRGFVDFGTFLLEEAKLKVRISDDCGRNPFHDIFWSQDVQLELAKLILERDPTLLLVGDKRGHTPFDYARPEDYLTWRTFLFENRELLKPLKGKSTRKLFCDSSNK